MAKTLRITGILAVIVAAVLLIIPAVLGRGSGREDIEQFIKSINALEKFDKNRSNRSARSDNSSSPLVEQSKKFALYLNPPPPPKRTGRSQTAKRSAAKKVAANIRPPAVKTKFKLVGTSYFGSSPDMSCALIDEPGKGLRWVKQGAKVGYLMIEEIKDGIVVIRDGKKTSELTTYREPQKSLVKRSFGIVDDETAAEIRFDSTLSDKLESSVVEFPGQTESTTGPEAIDTVEIFSEPQIPEYDPEELEAIIKKQKKEEAEALANMMKLLNSSNTDEGELDQEAIEAEKLLLEQLRQRITEPDHVNMRERVDINELAESLREMNENASEGQTEE